MVKCVTGAELQPCPRVTTAASLQQEQNELSGECVHVYEREISVYAVKITTFLSLSGSFFVILSVCVCVRVLAGSDMPQLCMH